MLRSGKDQRNDASSLDQASAVRASADQASEHGVTAGKRGTASVHSKDRDMGAALRSVYQKTVDERVPDDLLDLLGKLG